jgi:hypothetical protein
VAFPEQALGLKGELRVGTEWVNITSDLYTRDRITHTRGRPYRSSSADPASCSATIKNLDGKYTPRNAEGPYFGLIGRNTPFRISIPGAPAYLATTNSFLGNVGVRTPDAAALGIVGDLDARIEATLDNWNAAGSVELCGKGTLAGNQRSWLLMMRDGRLHFEWSADGASTTQVDSTALLPIPASQRLAVRVTLDVNNGASGSTTTFYYADTIGGAWTQLGAPVVTAGVTSIFVSTAALTAGNGWLDVAFPGPSGKVHAFELRNGIGGAVVANPDFALQTPGVTSFTDGAGLTWTVLSGSEISSRVTRLELEVPEWPPEWSTSEQDAWTSITAAGILRRLGQGDKPLASTLRRRIPSYKPLAYWPMEEGQYAEQAYSPIAGVRPLKLTAARWAQADTLPSSNALPVIAPSSTNTCDMMGRVPAPSTTLTQWGVQWMYRLDTPNATERTFLRILSTGTVAEWYVQSGNGGTTIVGKDSDGTTLFAKGVATGADLFGQWVKVEVFAAQSGSNVNWQVTWVKLDGTAGAYSDSFAGTVGRPKGVASPPNGYSSDLSGMALGHISVWSSADTPAFDNAITAWAGETAGARMVRLCQEEAVPLTIVGNTADTAPVGPQAPAPLLDLLRECAEADGGIFGEAQDRRELIYRTRTDMYNQSPKLTLDYAAGQVAPPFKPVEDDSVRNSWEVKRAGGSSGTAVLDAGPLSVLDPPDGIGLYEDSATLNLYADEQTEPMANWLLHLSTWDENRYPSVTVLLHKAPELIPAVLALQVGDKIRITGLPKRFTSSGVVELLVDGWTETFHPRAWQITFGCSPAGPWSVGVVGDAVLGKVQTDGSELAEAVGATDTTLSVAVTDGPLWTTDPAESPWDIKVGGEHMTVTAVGSVLTANPLLLADASGWTGNNAAVTYNNTNTSRIHTARGAVASLFIVPNGTSASGGANSVTTPVGSITPGTSYTACLWAYSAGGWSDLRAAVDWYDINGTFLSSALGSGTAVAAGVWTFLSQTFTAPANASRAVVRARHGGTPAAGNTWYAWNVRLIRPSAASALDAFNRTVTSGWGTADSGGAWTMTGGNSSDYSVQGV